MAIIKALKIFVFVWLTGYFSSYAQNSMRVIFDEKDSTDGYYLAVLPLSNSIKGVLVMFTGFTPPESMLPETRLHNVAAANDLLTVYFSVKQKIYADSTTVSRINTILDHVVKRYAADTSKFVLGAYDLAGNIALRYTELSRQYPSKTVLKPAAVFTVNSPVDLFALWNWCNRQIKRDSRSAWDGKFLIDLMTKETGDIRINENKFEQLTAFNAGNDSTGNERYLKDVPVRLYYDADMEWQLKERGNSLADTYLPEGTELISRLINLNNKEAEFIEAKGDAKNIRGIRTPYTLSIVDEVDCIHWIKAKLDIFDAVTWRPPYNLKTPHGWSIERFEIPIEFAPEIRYKGVEDVRFAPGWGDPKSPDYWTYAYLWWLEGMQQIDATNLQNHIKAYYEGLIGRNMVSRNIPAAKRIPTRVSIIRAKSAQPGQEQFEGSVYMLDYMTQKPITLNLGINVQRCAGQKHTAVIIKVSPTGKTHRVWAAMDEIYHNFECN